MALLLSLNSSKNTLNALVWNGDRKTTENFRLIGSCFTFMTFKEPIEHSSKHITKRDHLIGLFSIVLDSMKRMEGILRTQGSRFTD